MKNDSKAVSTHSSATGSEPRGKNPYWLMAILLAVTLLFFFWKSFDPNKVLFSNDGPLGIMNAEQSSMPGMLTGVWQNLNWLGNDAIGQSPNVTGLLLLIFKASPRAFLNAFYPVSLFFVGMGACFCLRKFKLAPMACVLGGLAAALNSDFLSMACWGLASDVIAFGATFFALGLLASATGPRRWVKIVIAGAMVGLDVMEGYDLGAIFSLFVAAFALYHSLFLIEKGTMPGRLAGGLARLAVVATCAVIIAVYTLSTLVSTQIQGIAGTQQDEATKSRRWNEATQWSVPKAEALQIFIPGIFGYRMDSPNGANYWGGIGRDPNINEALAGLNSSDESLKSQSAAYLNNSGLLWRFSGTGLYAGVPVVIIALWAIFQGWRKDGSPFSLMQRRAIRYWSIVILACLLLSFGRYAPMFYKMFYALPYASTIRSPLKFMHVLTWALIIVFGYGVHGLMQLYMQNSVKKVGGIMAQIKAWLATASGFEKKWFYVSLTAIPAALLAWLIYASANSQFLANLPRMGIDSSIAPSMAKYTLHTLGWFTLFLAITVGLMALIFSGRFTGPRAKWAGIILGLIMFIDLGRADLPWIVYWDVDYKYASNPIIKKLAEKPYEGRVTQMPFASANNDQVHQQIDMFRSVYGIEWHQHVFPYFNIQTLEMVQEPRVTVDKTEYLAAIPYPPVAGSTPATMLRTWELMNTRYMLGQGGGFVEALNQQLDHGQNRFHIVQSFHLAPKEGTAGTSLTDYTAVPTPDGELALIEFTGALPRAKLFSNWQVSTNNQATLATMASATFDPHKTVLISEPGFDAPLPANVDKDPGTVEITQYQSKHIELTADVKVPAILFFDERYHVKWHLTVDDKPAKQLRADFIMRGLYLEPGKHRIVMQYETPLTTLYVSLAAVFITLGLCAFLAFSKEPTDTAESGNSSPKTGQVVDVDTTPSRKQIS